MQVTDREMPDPPDYGLCSARHLGWRRYRLIMLESGERTPPFIYLESQAFPVLGEPGDATAGRRATAEGARQFGLDVLDDAHELLHPWEQENGV